MPKHIESNMCIVHILLLKEKLSNEYDGDKLILPMWQKLLQIFSLLFDLLYTRIDAKYSFKLAFFRLCDK